MKTNINDLINDDVPLLIDFHAEWCGPCHMMAPILEQVKTSMGENLRVIKIDVDKNEAFAGANNIRSIPTMILFQKGKQLWRHSGVMQAKQLEQTIKEYVSL